MLIYHPARSAVLGDRVCTSQVHLQSIALWKRLAMVGLV